MKVPLCGRWLHIFPCLNSNSLPNQEFVGNVSHLRLEEKGWKLKSTFSHIKWMHHYTVHYYYSKCPARLDMYFALKVTFLLWHCGLVAGLVSKGSLPGGCGRWSCQLPPCQQKNLEMTANPAHSSPCRVSTQTGADIHFQKLKDTQELQGHWAMEGQSPPAAHRKQG